MNASSLLQSWSRRVLTLLLTGGIASAAQAAEPEFKLPNREKYLVFDSRWIDSADGVQLVLGQAEKEPQNPLLVQDKPWEVRFDNLYANVCYDDQDRLFKCWYSPFIIDPATSGTSDEKKKRTTYREALQLNSQREMGLCYAVSKDGLIWEKPELGIVEFGGSTRNNLVMRAVHGAGICKDLNERNPARRYKAFYTAGTMTVAFSPDGLHWTTPVPCPQIDAVGDTHNILLWDNLSGKYVGITRLWRDGQRIVGRTQSNDCLTWTRAEEVLRGQDSRRQTYAMPVFRYADVYLGLVMMFDTQTDLVDCELAWSPNTILWERICPGTPLIPRGPEGSCDNGCIYGAAYPILHNGQLRLYYSGSDGPHTNWRRGSLCLARLRPDGFAALQPKGPGSAGRVTTKPIRCLDKQLRVTAEADGGTLQIALLDAEGKERKRSRPVSADGNDVPVTWEDASDLAAWVGKPLRLRFELTQARLYAFGFSPLETNLPAGSNGGDRRHDRPAPWSTGADSGHRSP